MTAPVGSVEYRFDLSLSIAVLCEVEVQCTDHVAKAGGRYRNRLQGRAQRGYFSEVCGVMKAGFWKHSAQTAPSRITAAGRATV